MNYDQWNARRRKDWPNAKHSAWTSEQVIEPPKGFELVADWSLNYIRDPIKENGMTPLQELFDRLDRHDWYYQMSDDHRCWVAGEADNASLNEMAAKISGGPELKSAFSAHYFTGEPWGNEKQPKPDRPTDEAPELIGYICEPDILVRLQDLSYTLHGGTDRERDAGHILGCMIESIMALPINEGELS